MKNKCKTLWYGTGAFLALVLGCSVTKAGVYPEQLKGWNYPATGTNRLFMGAATGDFNGDGIAEVALLKKESSHISIVSAPADDQRDDLYSFDIPGGSDFIGISASDVDGDGVDELVVLRNAPAAPSTVSNILVYKIASGFSGVSLLTELRIGTGNYGWKGVAVGDFEGDGKSEIVVSKNTAPQFSFYQLSTTGNLVQKSTVSLPNDAGLNDWRGLAAGDLDADGKAELVAVRYASGTNADWLFYKVALSGTTWTVTDAGQFNYNGGTVHYPWQGVAIGEFDRIKSNGNEFVVYKNSHSYFIYNRYRGSSLSPSVAASRSFSSESAYPWTGIAAGNLILNNASDELACIRQQPGTAGVSLVVLGDEASSASEKLTNIQRNGFCFGTYHQNLFRVPSDGSLDIPALKSFLDTNHVQTFSFVIAHIWRDPSTNSYPQGREYKSLIEFLDLLKSTNSPIKVMVYMLSPVQTMVGTNPKDKYIPTPADSPLIGAAELGVGITDERSLFSDGPTTPDGNDFVAWFKLLGIVGKKYPNLVGICIDDFSADVGAEGSAKKFTPTYLGEMMTVLRQQNEKMVFLPGIYYNIVDAPTLKWVRNYTDGFVFYFRNQKTRDDQFFDGIDVLKVPAPTISAAFNMHGAVVLPSTVLSDGEDYITEEMNDVRDWMSNENKIMLLGIYATGHTNSLTVPTPFTTGALMDVGKNMTLCDGVLMYVTQDPSTPMGSAIYSRFGTWW